MKRNIFSIFLILLFTLTCFSGCGNSNGNTTPKITFYSGDAVYYTLETEGNKILDLPTSPSKAGFSFEGWFYDKDTWLRPFTKYDYEKKALTESVSVYAKFRQSRLNYNINFYNGENLHATIRTQGYEVLTLPQNPERTNHIFDGWFFDDGTFLKQLTKNTYASKNWGKMLMFTLSFYTTMAQFTK